MTAQISTINKPKEVSYFGLNNLINIPTMDGKIQLDKDKQAVKQYFLEHVNQNTVFFYNLEEKIDYLIENDYIEKWFIDLYDFEFIKELFQELYDEKFRFETFMGAFKFYNQYAMKTRDGKKYLERYEDRIAFMSLYLGQGDEELALNIAKEHINQRIQSATPTFINAGKKSRGEMVSCFLIDINDEMNSIGRSINSALQLSKLGGGVGLNLSNLRESGAPIKGIENAASGVVPVMKILEDSFSYANQLGQRQGAGVTYLSVFHPDIYDFLSTKKENADEKVRVKTLSLGLTVPDKYYELLKTNEPMYLFSPHDVERVYGKPFSYVNIKEEYDNMVSNDSIKKYKTNARELEQEISKLQQESGYPYIINIDTANSENPVFGDIIMSNLCVHGDTQILTKDGYQNIKSLAGQKAEVWNGEEWSEVDVVQTNTDQELLHIKTDSGYDIKTTPYHKFYVLEWTEAGKRTKPPRYKEVRAGELKPGDALIKFDLPVIDGGKELELAYDNGFYSGDGATYPNGKSRLDLYGDKKELLKYLPSVKKWSEIKISDTETRLSGAASGLNEKFFVPSDGYSVKSKLSWLAGYLDADGTVTNNNGSQSLQIASINKEFLQRVQLMLQTLGADSKVVIHKEAGTTMLPKNDGTGEYAEYETKEIYRILINGNSLYSLDELGLKCNRLIWEVKKPNRKASKFIRIESVEKVDGLHDTFCFTEPKRHMGMFNGLLTGNCSEILQVQKPSKLNPDLSYDELGYDISCNLASTNVFNIINSDDFETSVDTAIRMLSKVAKSTSIKEVPTIENANKKYRSVGLGSMGLHEAFARNKIHYGSEESLEFTDAYFRALRFYALKTSNKLAKETGDKFFEFEKSEYSDGSYIKRKYIDVPEFEFTYRKVEDAFSKVHIPTKQDWEELSNSIMEHGLYNSYLLTVAPTGSISYINETTSSIHPIVNRIENRQEGKIGSVFYPAPGLSDETLPYYKSAYDTDMRKVIDVYATAQYHVDQGMSLTLFMRSEIPEGLYEWKNGKTNKMTTRDLNRLRNYAWSQGIKSIYYIRTHTGDDDKEIGVNECESCVI